MLAGISDISLVVVSAAGVLQGCHNIYRVLWIGGHLPHEVKVQGSSWGSQSLQVSQEGNKICFFYALQLDNNRGGCIHSHYLISMLTVGRHLLSRPSIPYTRQERGLKQLGRWSALQHLASLASVCGLGATLMHVAEGQGPLVGKREGWRREYIPRLWDGLFRDRTDPVLY